MNLFNIIKQKCSILSIISEYVTLKKTGSYYKGRCPFHSEKTGSFTVSPEKEIFYCFGCQSGGDVISFIAKIENCSQLEAAKIISQKYNIDLPDNQESDFNNLDKFNKKKEYIKTNEIFLKWAQKNLLKSKLAQDYLNKRAINKNSIDLFEIGFVPSGTKNITELISFAKKNNILTSDLIDSKILIEGKHGIYSPFEDRIIFGIKDHLGNLLGFGGRIIKEEDNRAKYYNSHDNQFFNKGSLLFGLDLAKKKIQEKNAVFLVEGYIDTIMMTQNDFLNTVATLGTACTKEHLTQLSRYTQRLYLLYDQDIAGQKAIIRLIESCWQANIDLYVISLPKGEDPASYLEKNNDLKSLILNTKDIFTFYLEYIGSDFDKQSLNQKIISTKKLIDIIFSIDDLLKQDLLLKQASQAFNIPFETLKYELTTKKEDRNNYKVIHEEKQSINNINIHDTSKITQLEKKIFSAIIDYKEAHKSLNIEDTEFLKDWFSLPIKEIFSKMCNNEDLSQEDKTFISKIVIEADNNNSLEELMTEFYKKQWKDLVYNIKLKINQAEKTGNSNLTKTLLAELDLLKKKILKRGIHGQR